MKKFYLFFHRTAPFRTGSKTTDGGLNDGLLSFLYHVFTDLAVAIPPAIPTNSQKIIEPNNRKKEFIIVIIYYLKV